MTAMVSTVSRCLSCCALLTAIALLSGCTNTVLGSVRAAAPPPDEPVVVVPVVDLPPGPERFPAGYPAVVLDAAALPLALQDTVGVAAGSVVTPAQCAPPPAAPEHSAAVRGADSEIASSLTVIVTRPATPLRVRADQLAACPSFTATLGADTSAITATLLPAPPVDAEDTYAVDQTVTTQPSGSERRMRTLAAQVGDALVTATWLNDGDPDTEPDMRALDALFTDAVLKVRRTIG